jgi:RNA polymerase sigma-70 factor (ECF subfamily)
MDQQELIPHLFRTEYRNIVSVLARKFGFGQVEIAEDMASDTFLAAAQVWGIGGLPQNPVAWLYQVAKNKAVNYLQRDNRFRNKVEKELTHLSNISEEPEIDLSPGNIKDSQLQMMFAICHPSIPPEAQIGLSLRILCGFGINEIADAFLTSTDTINKRLFRAREKLRAEKIEIVMPDTRQMEERLDTVLTTIYLLFNEGYFSVSDNSGLRKDLCLEAMRLCHMLVENPVTDKPSVNALLALMCFHASRFDARIDQQGTPVLYDEQDESLWNQELISHGGFYLKRSATGDVLSRYHLEASIAFWSTQKNDTREKWENVLELYDRFLGMEYSPAAMLNRIYALSKVKGKEFALPEAEKLAMNYNPFYFLLLGELNTGIDNRKAAMHFRKALEMVRTESARQIIRRKIERAEK